MHNHPLCIRNLLTSCLLLHISRPISSAKPSTLYQKSPDFLSRTSHLPAYILCTTIHSVSEVSWLLVSYSISPCLYLAHNHPLCIRSLLTSSLLLYKLQLWRFLIYSPSTSQVKSEETSENVVGALMHLKQQLKEISKWNTPLTSCTVQVLYLQELRSL